MNNATALTLSAINLRALAAHERHPLGFSTFKALLPGESMALINDHNPEPVRDQFESGLLGAFNWNLVENGPEHWRVQIVKPAESQPVHGVDTCCGACGTCGG